MPRPAPRRRVAKSGSTPPTRNLLTVVSQRVTHHQGLQNVRCRRRDIVDNMISESSTPPPQAELDPMPDIIQPSQLSSNGTLSMLPSFQAHTTDAFNSPCSTQELPIACCPLPPSTYPSSSERHSLGSFTVVCPSCGALHWMEERLAQSSERSPKFGMCCKSGKISWPAMPDPPEPLRSLLDGANQSNRMSSASLNSDSLEAKEFRENIRNYNNAFAFSSLGVKIDPSVYGAHGIFTFRIQGELCHRISTLLPPDGEPPKFAQLYIYDSDPQSQAQMRANRVHDKVDVNTVLQLQQMIELHNPYVATYRTAKERLDSEEHVSLCLKTVDIPHLDQRRYNHPTASEVGIIMVGNGEDGATERDLIVQARGGRFHSISYLKSSYIPLRFPIAFVYGEQGWHPNIYLGTG